MPAPHTYSDRRFPTTTNPFNTPAIGRWKTAIERAFCDDNEREVWRLFCKLEEYFDPVLLFDRGPVKHVLVEILDVWEDRPVGKELRWRYYGYDWDLNRFFEILKTQSADSKPFQGAARCIMKWLINLWFEYRHEKFEDNRDERGELFWVVEGLRALPYDRRRPAWIAMLCNGRGNFGGNLISRYRSSFKREFSYLDRLDDGELVREVQKLPKLVLEFRDWCNGFLPYHDPPSVHGPRAKALSDIEKRLEEAVRGTRNYHRIDEAQLRCDMSRLSGIARLEEITAGEARTFLRHLIWRMTLAMKEELDAYMLGLLHHNKNHVESSYVAPLKQATNLKEKVEIADAARRYIQAAGRILRSRKGGKDAKPIQAIKPLVTLFSEENLGATVIKTLDAGLYVAGFDSAREEVLIPLWEEIARNVKRALCRVMPTRRVVSILGEKREIAGSWWAVFEITNTRDPDAPHDEHSTGFGKTLLNKMAKAFHDGVREGSVGGNEARLCNLPAYCTTVRLPLWTGPLPENARGVSDG